MCKNINLAFVNSYGCTAVLGGGWVGVSTLEIHVLSYLRGSPGEKYRILRIATSYHAVRVGAAVINAPPPMGPLGRLMRDPGASFSKYPRGFTIPKGCQP